MPDPATRDPEAGVTLVEMLVAVALSALIGLAGFGMLDTVLRVGDRAGARLDETAALDRAFRVIGRDVMGAAAPMLTGDTLRLGEDLSYGLEGDRLTRRIGGVDQVLASEVAAARWQALEAGTWRDTWDEAPPALRLCLTLPQGELCRLFPGLPGPPS